MYDLFKMIKFNLKTKFKSGHKACRKIYVFKILNYKIKFI